MLKRLPIHFSKLSFIIGLGLWCSVASSAILSPGSSITLSGTTSTIDPDLAGTIIHEYLIGFEVTDPSGDTLLTGNYLDRVIRSNNTNQLIFSGRIQDLAVTSENSLGIYDWLVTGFSGYQTDVDYRSDDIGDLAPDQATRLNDGNDILFDFPTELEPPESSLFSSIATDAARFDLSGSAFFGIEDFVNDTDYLLELNGIAAPSPVPLPAAFWLFGSAMIGLIGFQRQRRKE
ncbi:MAG: VPLPA-CTERM sorting domain-containing protein [Candidatus Thiodiazotropha endolucinida]|nr:VPLPA-CTERM sorting domain-containing protein [Candidatus Thiodiazotropha taylori]MCW4317134.1 VPLPA-CTERM sorting domain-containing protein [Candidatus Thiodiazotropha taylori]